jgi:type IV pilus biogenesis protein CpaD/CtpE
MKFTHPFQSLIAAAAILSCLAGCDEKKQANGSCFYDRVDTMAEIISISENKQEVMLDFKASKLAFEPQELGALKGFTIDSAFVARNHLKVGNQYSVTVSEISQGDCIPLVVAFNHAFE